MNEIKTTIAEQLQQLQRLMQRTAFHNYMGAGMRRNSRRGQGRVLTMLKLKPEMSQKELTYLMGMSKQSLAELLAKLEKNRYITREQSEDDKRVMTIKLTEEGAKTADEVDDNTLEASKILDCLNDDELTLFSEYLSRIIKRYEEQFPEEDFEERRKMMEHFMSHYNRGFDERGGHSGDHHGDHHDRHRSRRSDRREGGDEG